MQLHKMASAALPRVAGLPALGLGFGVAHLPRLRLFSAAGIGGFRYAVVPHQGVWPAQGTDRGSARPFPRPEPFAGNAGRRRRRIPDPGTDAAGRRLARRWPASITANGAWRRSTPSSPWPPWRCWECSAPSWSRPPRASPIGRSSVTDGPFWPTGCPPRAFTFAAKALAGGAMAALACLHLYLRAPELLSERLYVNAMAASGNAIPKHTPTCWSRPCGSIPPMKRPITDTSACLTEFRREAEAVKHGRLHPEIRPGSARSATKPWRAFTPPWTVTIPAPSTPSAMLAWYPNHLPALEILMDAYRAPGPLPRPSIPCATPRSGLEGFYPHAPSAGIHHPRTGQPVHVQPRCAVPATLVRRQGPAANASWKAGCPPTTSATGTMIRLRFLKETRCLGGDRTRKSPCRKPRPPCSADGASPRYPGRLRG